MICWISPSWSESCNMLSHNHDLQTTYTKQTTSPPYPGLGGTHARTQLEGKEGIKARESPNKKSQTQCRYIYPRRRASEVKPFPHKDPGLSNLFVSSLILILQVAMKWRKKMTRGGRSVWQCQANRLLMAIYNRLTMSWCSPCLKICAALSHQGTLRSFPWLC